MQRKIIPFIGLNCFKTLEEDVDSVFLDLNELSKIHNLDLLTNPGLIKYRDMFIVGCLTGFRFSDYSTLNRSQLKNGMLHVRQNKTGATVVVPLRDDAEKS